MSTVTRYVCPGCSARVKTPVPVAPGRHIKCPRCQKVFAATATPQAAAPTQLAAAQRKETKLAATVKETKLAPTAKQTKLTAATAKPTTLAKPQTAPALVNQIFCPKCRVVFHTPGPSPVGRNLRCPRCTAVFAVTADQCRRVPAKPPATPAKPQAAAGAKPQAAKPTKLAPPPPTLANAKPPVAPPPKKTAVAGGPVFAYTCPGCAVVLKTAMPLPAGKQIKCPRCQRIFAATKPTIVKPRRPAKPQAAAKPTTLAKQPAAKPTTLAKQPAAKSTTLVAPNKRPVARIACPGCKAVLKLVGAPPAGAALKCPKCGRGLRILPRAKPQMSPSQIKPKPQVAKPQAAAAKPKEAFAKPQAAPAKPPAAPAKRREILPILYLVAMFAIASGFVGFHTYSKGWWGHSIPSSAWVMFKAPDGRCEILMPGNPTASPAAVHGDGIISGQHYMVKRPEEGAGFILVISDRDAKVTAGKSFQELYVPVHNYILNQHPDGEVLWEDDIKHGEHPGKEIQVRLNSGDLLIARVFLVRGQPYDRLYILVAAGPWRDPRRGDPAKFFDSFKIENGQPVIRPGKDKRRVRVA